MKRLLLLCTALAFLSCSQEETTNDFDGLNLVIDGQPTNVNSDNITEASLLAGQTIDVGLATVTANQNVTTFKYETTGDWIILETHLYVGTLEDVPHTNSGNPKIGHFPYKSNHTNNTQSVTYNVGIIPQDGCVFVFAHAVVYNVVTGEEETAWAEGFDAPGNNWAMYFEACN